MSEAQINKLFAEQAELSRKMDRMITQQQQQLLVIREWGKHAESYGKQVACLRADVSGAIEHMRELTQRFGIMQRQLDRHDSDLYPAVSTGGNSK